MPKTSRLSTTKWIHITIIKHYKGCVISCYNMNSFDIAQCFHRLRYWVTFITPMPQATISPSSPRANTVIPSHHNSMPSTIGWRFSSPNCSIKREGTRHQFLNHVQACPPSHTQQNTHTQTATHTHTQTPSALNMGA